MSGRDERVVAEWEASPYTSFKRRHVTIGHRVIVEPVQGVGVDVHHEARLDAGNGPPGEWTPLEVYEARPHGIEHIELATEGDLPA